jgi:WD40 repeat protein
VVSRGRQYEAFISYSHAADNALAAQLQRTLNRIARPSYKWWHWWPPRVFRDQTNLAPAGDLSGEIQRALGASGSLVLLASPLAAASPWVDKEAATWRETKPPGRLFLALTEGALEWDDARGDFDPERTTSLPPSLQGAFDAEPLWIDFTGVREDRPFARDPLFLDGAASLAAAIRGVDKDALIGEDVRQRRRARQLAGGAITVVALLAIAATIAAILALVQRDRATERARLALSRQYAAQSVAALEVDPERSVVLAARAARTAPTDEADSALRRALRASRLRSVVDAGAGVEDVDAAAAATVVAAALANGGVRVWKPSDDAPARTFRVGGGKALGVSLSRNGGRVLGVSPSRAVVWPTDGDETPLAELPTTRVLSGALSPDGTTAATGHHGGTVRLWGVDTGRLRRELRPPGPPAPVTAVALSNDGARLAAAVGQRLVVWNLRGAGAPLVRFGDSDISAVAFSPDDRRIATGDNDGVVRVGTAVLTGHEGKVTSVAFAPDGGSLVTGAVDETARIWDLRTARTTAELRGHDGLVLGVAFERDGKTVVTGGSDRAIRSWAVSADPVRVVRTEANGLRVNDVAFDPSGSRVVSAGKDGKARIWQARSGRMLSVLPHGAKPDDWVESARFDSTGRVVATAGDDGAVRVWDGRALQRVLRLPGGREAFDVAISPDGSEMLAGGAGGMAHVWRSGKLAGTLRTPAESVRGVAFSPDGKLLAVGGGGAIRIWRAGSYGRPAIVLRDPSGAAENEVWSVAFSPDGERIAAGNWSGAWTVWDVATREIVARAKGHVDTVADVAFSPDGAYLATAGWDGAVKVWAIPGGGLVTATRTPSRELEAVAFAPRGRIVAVAGTGGRTTLFECAECRTLDELVCVAAERVTPAVRAKAEDAFADCD